MHIYKLVRMMLAGAGITDTPTIQKYVGTARTMGFEDELSDSNTKLLTDLLLPRIAKKRKEIKPIKVTAAVDSVAGHVRFDEIDSLRGRNLCPRCKKEMNPGVKLADYQITKYCKHCKVALWPNA